MSSDTEKAQEFLKVFEGEEDGSNGKYDVITLLERDRENDITIFKREPYRYIIQGVMQKVDGLRAIVTLEGDDNRFIYKDHINFSRATARKRFCVKNIEGDPDHDLIRIEDLMTKIIRQEVKDDLKPKQPYVMNEEERKQAENYLKTTPHILKDILKVTDRLGVVGEMTNRLMIYLVFTSRIMNDPLSLTIKGESSSGKSFLAQGVMKLVPGEGVRFITRATAQAMYHLPEDGMQHKIIYINELPGSESSDYAIRSAQSEGDLILMMPIKDPNTGNIETTEKIVRGPVGFLVTTTQVSLFHENETRNFSVFTDDSPRQTEEIKKIITRIALGDKFTLSEDEFRFWQNIQRLLKTDLKVVIPFAEEVFSSFPDRPLRIRRDVGKFKTLIEVITVLHQFHRKIDETEDGKVIYATVADYYLASQIAGDVLFSSIYQMPPESERLLCIVREQEEKYIESGGVGGELFTFCYDDVCEWMDWYKQKARRFVKYLLTNEFVQYAAVYKTRNEKRFFKVTKREEQKRFLKKAAELLVKYPCDKKLLYNPFVEEKNGR